MRSSFHATSAVLLGGLLLAPLAFATGRAAAQPAPPAAAAPTTWTVDPVHSAVLFRIQHLGAAWIHGRFDAFSGSVVLDAEQPAASSVQFAVETASVNTNSKDRDDHLRSPDFFNAKVHPKMSFRSTAVADAGPGRFQVQGILALNGKERELAFVAERVGTGKNMQGKEVMGFEAVLKIRRKDFGISIFPDAIGDEVTVTVSVEAIRQD